MTLTKKQINKIQEKLKKKSAAEVATLLDIPLSQVEPYARKTEPVQNNGNNLDARINSFSFLIWFREHKKRLLLLILLVLLSYIYTFNYAFLSDDIDGIVHQNLTDFTLITHHPMQFGRSLEYFFVNAFFGKSPGMFRLTNISAHMITVSVIYIILYILISERAALFSAILVAVHPIMVEAVTWVSGGGYSSYSAFCLISLLFFILRKKHWSFYWISLVSFLTGLIFSEKAVAFSGILFIYVILLEDIRKYWKHLLPYFLLSSLWILKLIGLLGIRQSTLETNFTISATNNINPVMRVIVAIGSYIELILWPNGLTLYHSEMNFSYVSFTILICLFMAYVGLIFWLFYRAITHHDWMRSLGFWFSFLIISVSPTLVPGAMAWIVAERYAYFGAVGILTAVGILVDHWSQNKRRYEVVVSIFSLVALILFTRTVVRNLDWQDQDHLWLAAERTSPNSAQNNNNLGDLYTRQGDFNKATYYFSRATQLEPCYGDAYHNLAISYTHIKKYDEAITNLHKAVACKPILWQSHEMLAQIYYVKGEMNLALDEINTAIKINPSQLELQRIRDEIVRISHQ